MSLKLELNPSEKIKSISTVDQIINKLLSKIFNRNDLIIAIGGGIIGDTTSFVAVFTKRSKFYKCSHFTFSSELTLQLVEKQE